MYPVGRHIGLRNIVTNSMKFIKQGENVSDITSLNINTMGNRRYLAICEKRQHDPHAWVSFYDLKNLNAPKYVKSINFSEIAFGNKASKEDLQKSGSKQASHFSLESSIQNGKRIISFSFSRDNKIVAVLIVDSSGETKALIYDWVNKHKVLASYDFTGIDVNKISLNQKDWNFVATSGPGHWKVWKIQENSFKQLPQFQRVKQDRNFTDHAWLDDDKIVAGTSHGELILLENYEQK